MSRRVSGAEIAAEARRLGAELVGFAPVGRWDEECVVPEAYRPDRIWAPTRTVVVLGAPVWLPILEAAPSEWGREQYTVTNELLDLAAYRLAAFLNRRGHASLQVPRDGYGDLSALERLPAAFFSHAWAGRYAGLGTVGWNHTLLTPQFGPRVRLVSVLTALEIPGTPLLDEDLCSRCLACQRACPVGAFTGSAEDRFGSMDKHACMGNSRRLRAAFRNPCGFCIRTCPVGEDRKLFRRADRSAAGALAHIRRHGGHPLLEDDQSAGRGRGRKGR